MALDAGSDAVEIEAVGPVACAAFAWRNAGQLRLTVVVKATFAVVPDADMTLADPIEVLRADIPHRNNPTMSARYARDTAPYVPRADVVLVGSAWAPEGTRAPALTVGLSLYRDRPLLEKRIHVYGDRLGQELSPFDQMALCYERAYGGLGFPDNPFGTGNKDASPPPNLIDPLYPKRPTCFAPLPASWPSRKRLLGKAQHEGLRQPLPDVAADVNWSYFQVAPPDQQVDHLTGDEWLVLDGVHPRFPRIRSRLPEALALAHVLGLGDAGQGQPLGLVADTLAIDADDLTCAVTWRASFPVPSAKALATIRVVAGVATASAPIDWEAALAAAAHHNEPVGPAAAQEDTDTSELDETETREIDPSPTRAPRAHAAQKPSPAQDWAGTVELPTFLQVAKATLPFQSSTTPAGSPARAPLPPPRPPPEPPSSHPKAKPPPLAPPDPHDWAGTVDLAQRAGASTRRPTMPFTTAPELRPAAAASAPQQGRPQALDWGQTADLPPGDEHGGAPRKTLPFVQGVTNLPPTARAGEHDFTGTVAIGDDAPPRVTLPFHRAPAPPPTASAEAPPATPEPQAAPAIEPPKIA